ncbi:hypothetical protein DQ354_13705 [Arthrobacter sp. AQ5-06]|nr:hypothetical protein DQ354_13705 [Arthrobacter sp. AQ5-06]
MRPGWSWQPWRSNSPAPPQQRQERAGESPDRNDPAQTDQRPGQNRILRTEASPSLPCGLALGDSLDGSVHTRLSPAGEDLTRQPLATTIKDPSWNIAGSGAGVSGTPKRDQPSQTSSRDAPSVRRWIKGDYLINGVSGGFL